jgi:hypothetical protein
MDHIPATAFTTASSISYPSETFRKLCRLWYIPSNFRDEEVCLTIPCKHSESTDIDKLTKDLDWIEDPEDCRLSMKVFRGRITLDELKLSAQEMAIMEERLA